MDDLSDFEEITTILFPLDYISNNGTYTEAYSEPCRKSR